MRQIFNYRKFNNDAQNELVEAFGALSNAHFDGKANTPEYKEANKQFNEDFMKECCSAIPDYNVENFSLDSMKDPMIYNNIFFQQRFNTLLAQMITPIIPQVVASGYEDLYDVTQVGFGDNAKYEVMSNELFILNDAAIGVARGGVQTDYNTEYTVQARKKQVAAYVDWYHVAAGKQDWGHFAVKCALAVKMYIDGRIVKALEGVVSNLADRTRWGINGYVAGGFSDANWLAIARNIKLANGGAQVYALGTKLALQNVLPTSAAAGVAGFSYRSGEDGAMIQKGYLPSYKEVPLIELENFLQPNTINDIPAVMGSDKIIYMLPVGMNKPVKVVFEGNSITVQKDPIEMADRATCC